jgi:hypothetical protein
MDNGLIPAGNLDGYFYYAFRYAAGMALQRASLLNTQCRMIAVSDQHPPHNIAGPNQAQSDWEAHGRRTDIVGYPHASPKRFGTKKALAEFRPIISIWGLPPGNRNARKAFEGPPMAPGFARMKRIARDDRVCLIGTSSKQALDAAFAILKYGRKEGFLLRILCDFGRKLGEGHPVNEDALALICARRDWPVDGLLATHAYAMQAKYELGEAIKITLASAPGGTNHQDENGLRRPSTPTYIIQPVAR